MPILTKEVEIKLWGQNLKHYKNLGYVGKHGDIVTVKVEDLQDGSNASIQYLCDYCGKEIMTMVYADFTRRTKEVNKMACKHCYPEKVKEINLLRFGVSSYAKTDEFHKKMEDMMTSKYGVKHYSKTQEYKEKWNKTCLERYGESYRKKFINKAFETFSNNTGYNYPSQSPDVRKKMIQTCINHFGVDNPLKSEEIKEKVRKTSLEKYGYTTPSQFPDVKEKAAKTFYKNGTIPTSKQQRYIYNLYNTTDSVVKLNFPISCYNADICFPIEKMTMEYDGGFHNGQVKLGNITQEEFNQKEIVRNNIIKKEGYKQIRIISSKDLLPSDQILFQILYDAKQYFYDYPNHSWIEFDIDDSSIRSAEYKDGIPYNYGKLRRIKDSYDFII